MSPFLSGFCGVDDGVDIEDTAFLSPIFEPCFDVFGVVTPLAVGSELG